MKAEAVRTVIRDTVSFGVGIFIILHEEFTQHVSWALLTMAATLCGLPGAVALFQAYRSTSEIPPTPEPLSSPPSSSLPS